MLTLNTATALRGETATAVLYKPDFQLLKTLRQTLRQTLTPKSTHPGNPCKHGRKRGRGADALCWQCVHSPVRVWVHSPARVWVHGPV